MKAKHLTQICLLCMAMLPGMVQAQFTFITNNGAITITKYTGSGSSTVVVPSTTNGYPVTSIGNSAFSNSIGVTSITIPNSVTNMGNEVFEFCYSLTSVTIGTNVTSIGNYEFDECYVLASITIPNSVTNIGPWAFLTCSGLTNVTIGNSVTSIGEFAFDECSGLANLTIPKSVTDVSDYAFGNCSSLTGVFFAGNAPTTVGSIVFYADSATVYYLPGTTGWSLFLSEISIPGVLWNPTIQTTNASFGVQTNHFGFNITGKANIPIVVEACTNLASPVWVPLQSASLTNGSFYFNDPQWTNYPGRFYGIGWP